MGFTQTAAAAPHTHDGFFFNGSIGLGYSSFIVGDDPDTPPDITFKGLTGLGNLDFGGSPTENLALYVRLSDWIQTGPTVAIGDLEETASSDVRSGAIMFGVGLRYYLMPANVYLAGTIGTASYTIQEDNREIADTDFGLGLEFDFGKEWWVGDEWGVGIGGRLSYAAASSEDSGFTEDVSGASVGVLFTATAH